MPGSQTTPGRAVLALIATVRMAFRHRDIVGARGFPQTIRQGETAMAISTWWWDGHGHGSNPVAFPFGTNIINRHSRVVCSMCEIAQPPGEALDYPFIGGASMQILNVAPDDTGTVHVWVSVNWGSDLNCCFSSIHRLHYSTFRHST